MLSCHLSSDQGLLSSKAGSSLSLTPWLTLFWAVILYPPPQSWSFSWYLLLGPAGFFLTEQFRMVFAVRTQTAVSLIWVLNCIVLIIRLNTSTCIYSSILLIFPLEIVLFVYFSLVFKILKIFLSVRTHFKCILGWVLTGIYTNYWKTYPFSIILVALSKSNLLIYGWVYFWIFFCSADLL